MSKTPDATVPPLTRPTDRPARPGLWVGLFGALCVVAALIGGLWVYDSVASGEGITGLDRPVLAWVMSLRTPQANLLISTFTELGRTLPMMIVALAGCGLLYWRFRRVEVWIIMAVAALGSVGMTLAGKAAFGRLRPPVVDAIAPYETNFSFPSGHTLNATVIAGMLAYLVVWLSPRLWARVSAVIAATLWSVMMGLSRVYLGHHWLTDVVFAWLIGLAWLALLITAHQLLRRFPFARPAR